MAVASLQPDHLVQPGITRMQDPHFLGPQQFTPSSQEVMQNFRALAHVLKYLVKREPVPHAFADSQYMFGCKILVHKNNAPSKGGAITFACKHEGAMKPVEFPRATAGAGENEPKITLSPMW
jgi:hypothetical protein